MHYGAGHLPLRGQVKVAISEDHHVNHRENHEGRVGQGGAGQGSLEARRPWRHLSSQFKPVGKGGPQVMLGDMEGREGAVEDRHSSRAQLADQCRRSDRGVLNKMILCTYKTVLTAKPLRDRELLGRMRLSTLHRAWPLRGSLHCGTHSRREGGGTSF